MGELTVTRPTSGQDVRRFTRSILADLRALEEMLATDLFETGPARCGVEQEMYLVTADPPHRAAAIAPGLLAAVGDPRLTTELARFNLEANLEPRPLEGGFLGRLEEDLGALVAKIDREAARQGARVLLTGILPTLRRRDLVRENMTEEVRYACLEDALREVRGGAFKIFIRGLDLLQETFESVIPESANCSLQLHLQVDPARFTELYNLAQLISAPLVAAASNSPVLLAQRLWHETRVALFEASVDARSDAEVARGVQPRVNFGSDWLRGSVLELFRESTLRYRVLLMREAEHDPLEELRAGRMPSLRSLALHNGTIWRWNRPCYGVVDGRPTLRIENRVLPAGPTVLDEVANAALFYGLMSEMGRRDLGIPKRIAFDEARANFVRAARYGLDAHLTWLDRQHFDANDLLVAELLPAARRGLAAIGCDRAEIDRYLGVVEDRVVTRRCGSHWILDSLAAPGEATRERRLEAIGEALLSGQHSGLPVHRWELADATAPPPTDSTKVRAIMTRDLFTLPPDATAELAIALMHWRSVHHVPVEDAHGHLVGLVSATEALRLWANDSLGGDASVDDLMDRTPPLVDAEMRVRDAVELLLASQATCLLVTSGDRLVGLVTESDLLAARGAARTAVRSP